MNKKTVTILLVILLSFCFLGIVVAENATSGDGNATDSDKPIDGGDDDNATDDDKDKDKDDGNSSDENKSDDKAKKTYIIAKGTGNNIKFSDGYRGFILDYSKSPAKKGDEF